MMYIVFIINHIHNLMNKSKILIFVYNSNEMVYLRRAHKGYLV